MTPQEVATPLPPFFSGHVLMLPAGISYRTTLIYNLIYDLIAVV